MDTYILLFQSRCHSRCKQPVQAMGSNLLQSYYEVCEFLKIVCLFSDALSVKFFSQELMKDPWLLHDHEDQ